jgi:hypothetical protein
VKFTVTLPGLTLYPGIGSHWWERMTADQFAEAAQTFDELGYDYILVPTHFVMNRQWAPEMGSRWVHSLTAAGHILGATKRITVVPLVVVPYHNPVELAKALSTLDYMSGGRMIPLLLLGYNDWEFEVLRVPFAERAAIMNESIDAMVELWTADEANFDGKYVDFKEIVFDPKPAKMFPLWFGGRTHAALRRIAKYGDGWVSYATPRYHFRQEIEYLESQPAFQERPRPMEYEVDMFEGARDPYSHKVIAQPTISFEPDVILENLTEIAAQGATMAPCNDVLGVGKYQNDRPDSPPKTKSFEEFIERVHWFAEDVMPQARQIVTTRTSASA